MTATKLDENNNSNNDNIIIIEQSRVPDSAQPTDTEIKMKTTPKKSTADSTAQEIETKKKKKKQKKKRQAQQEEKSMTQSDKDYLKHPANKKTEPTTTIAIKIDDSPIETAAIKEKRKQKKKQPEKKEKTKNELTKLIPGYTAPMKLNTPSLDKFRSGLTELRKKAERTDSSTRDFVVGSDATAQHMSAMQRSKTGFTPSSYSAAYASFKYGTKRPKDNSAGKGWFGMKPAAMTDELKTDMAVIRNRNYLDPKKFYKSSDTFQKVVQVGTVIEGNTEYYSSRLTKKQRRQTLAEEIMADPEPYQYTKNKARELQRREEEQAMKRRNNKRSKKRKRYTA